MFDLNQTNPRFLKEEPYIVMFQGDSQALAVPVAYIKMPLKWHQRLWAWFTADIYVGISDSGWLHQQ